MKKVRRVTALCTALLMMTGLLGYIPEKYFPQLSLVSANAYAYNETITIEPSYVYDEDYSIWAEVPVTENGIQKLITWELKPDGYLKIDSTDASILTKLSLHGYEDEVKKVYISGTFTSIADDCFSQFVNIENIQIPDSITSIGANAFSGCSKLVIECSFSSCAAEYAKNNRIPYFTNDTQLNPEKYAYYNGHTYKVFDNVADTWEEAKKYCESLGGYLAVIGSDEENTAVYNIMKSMGYSSAYFGYTDIEEDGVWKWVGNEKSDYTNWHIGEPSTEYYAMFYWKWQYTWNDGTFDDRTDGGGKAFICEWDSYMTDVGKIIDSGQCGENVFWIMDSEGTLTISGIGDMYNYSSSRDVPWYSINSKIKEVIITDRITSVGNYTFAFTDITKVTLAESVTYIGSNAFAYCTELENINIPDHVDFIGHHAFIWCHKINVTIPYGVTSIESYAFFDCDSLTSVVIPDSVISIKDHAFYGSDNITSISIPESVTSIESSAFSGCSKLTHIHIPSNKTYADYAGKGSLPSEPSYYFPGKCGDSNCILNAGNKTTEEMLRSMIKNMYPNQEIIFFDCGDYYCNGELEAFAIVGTETTNSSLDGIYLLYVDSDGVTLLLNLHYYIHYAEVVNLGDSYLFIVDSNWGAWWTNSFMWVTEPNTLTLRQLDYEPDIFNHIQYDGNGDFYAIARDVNPKTGAIFETWYLYWNGEDLSEYGGIEITEEMFALAGGDYYIDYIESKGYVLDNILYRANNVININYHDASDPVFLTYYLTLILEDGELKLNTGYQSLEAAERNGVSHTAIWPEIATYPDAWPLSVNELPIDESHFPDAAFRAYILEEIDTDKNSCLSENEIQNARVIDVTNKGISDLTGIEYFTNLYSLICSSNSLESLDISKNTKLFRLDCSFNNISKLDLSNNTKLEELNCYYNSLLYLDLTNNTELQKLDCRENYYVLPFSEDIDQLINILRQKGLDPSKVLSWDGAVYNSTVDKIIELTGNPITYQYNCGSGWLEEFSLYLDMPEDNNYVKMDYVTQHIMSAQDAMWTKSNYSATTMDEYDTVATNVANGAWSSIMAIKRVVNLDVAGIIDDCYKNDYSLILQDIFLSEAGVATAEKCITDTAADGIETFIKYLDKLTSRIKDITKEDKKTIDEIKLQLQPSLATDKLNAKIDKLAEIYKKYDIDAKKARSVVLEDIDYVGNLIGIAGEAISTTNDISDALYFIIVASMYSEADEEFMALLDEIYSEALKSSYGHSQERYKLREAINEFKELHSDYLASSVKKMTAEVAKDTLSIILKHSKDIYDIDFSKSITECISKKVADSCGIIPGMSTNEVAANISLYIEAVKTGVNMGVAASDFIFGISSLESSVTKMYEYGVLEEIVGNILNKRSDDLLNSAVNGSSLDEQYRLALKFDQAFTFYKKVEMDGLQNIADYNMQLIPKFIQGYDMATDLIMSKLNFSNYKSETAKRVEIKSKIEEHIKFVDVNFNCHIDPKGLLNFKAIADDYKKWTTTIISCPVELLVYDDTGKLIGTVSKNKTEVDEKYQYYIYYIEESDSCVVVVPDGFSVSVRGTDTGTMDIIGGYSVNGEMVYADGIENVEIDPAYESTVTVTTNSVIIKDMDGNITHRTEYLKGDANMDGEVNSRDAALILRHAAGYSVDIDLEAANVTGDGDVNSRDAALILRKAAGYDVTFQ